MSSDDEFDFEDEDEGEDVQGIESKKYDEINHSPINS